MFFPHNDTMLHDDSLVPNNDTMLHDDSLVPGDGQSTGELGLQGSQLVLDTGHQEHLQVFL